jgi:thioredoxin reductase
MTARYDVAIVGGGPAGLSAAIWLARYLHKAVVVDSGDPRNWETRGINGYLGHLGIRSPELRALGREEGAKFGVEYMSGIVDEAINETGELFAIRLREGTVIEAERILLAIAPGPQVAVFAAASGAVAATALHASLVPESRKLPPV